MLQRINQYLLTNHPLIWNTRVFWILLLNAALHVVLFVVGYAGLRPEEISINSSVSEVDAPALYSFTFLGALLVTILWLVFYLRNNALKNNYPLPKGYLAAETLLILLVFLSTVTYFKSYHAGVSTKARAITSRSLLREEVNTVNRALAFIPMARSDYFILNNCNRTDEVDLNDGLDQYFDSSRPYYNDQENVLIRTALKRSDAFSYRHFCKLEIVLPNLGIDSASIHYARNASWIQEQRTDSIRVLLNRAVSIFRKYGVDFDLPVPALTARVVTNTNNSTDLLVGNSRYYDENNQPRRLGFLDIYGMRDAFNLLGDSHGLDAQDDETSELWLGIAYIALGLSILVLCYRRFNRQVFLISIIGSILWAIIIPLFSIFTYSGSSDLSWANILLFLCILFGGLGYFLLHQATRKKAAGVLLTWHIFLMPFIVFILLLYANNYYDDLSSNYRNALPGKLENDHPIVSWIHNHETLIAAVYFLLVFGYIAFIWNRWTKRWQAMPEE